MGLKGQNILVTGGRGFIASHLIEKLLDLNCNVMAVDIVENPNSYFFKKKFNKRVIFELCDITDFRRIYSIVINHKIDFVFHTAALALVEAAYNNPLETMNTNVMGTVNVMESCRLSGRVSGVIFTSTDKVYGKLPRVTELNSISGDHPYEVSKTSADLIARSYFTTYQMPVVVTRFGNVYGEGDVNFSRIIPGIMESVVNKKVLEIRSNGKYVRDYVYVKDVVEATTALAENIKKVKGLAFNISSLENLSVLEVIGKVENILGVKVEYKILSSAINEIPVQSINFKKIKNMLGWKPQNSFNNTISEIYNWYREYFEGFK